MPFECTGAREALSVWPNRSPGTSLRRRFFFWQNAGGLLLRTLLLLGASCPEESANSLQLLVGKGFLPGSMVRRMDLGGLLPGRRKPGPALRVAESTASAVREMQRTRNGSCPGFPLLGSLSTSKFGWGTVWFTLPHQKRFQPKRTAHTHTHRTRQGSVTSAPLADTEKSPPHLQGNFEP